jgi:soluble lytic murein transglycosylase
MIIKGYKRRKFLIIIMFLVLLMFAVFSSDWFWDIKVIIEQRDVLYRYSEEYGVDPLLAIAIIKNESSFKTYAQSWKGAIGLMQIMPETGKEVAQKLGIKPFCAEYLYEPEINIRIGLYYFSKLCDEFNGDICLALAAYNGGIKNIKRWLRLSGTSTINIYYIDDIPFPETKAFVKKVLKTYHFLKTIQRFFPFLI